MDVTGPVLVRGAQIAGNSTRQAYQSTVTTVARQTDLENAQGDDDSEYQEGDQDAAECPVPESEQSPGAGKKSRKKCRPLIRLVRFFGRRFKSQQVVEEEESDDDLSYAEAMSILQGALTSATSLPGTVEEQSQAPPPAVVQQESSHSPPPAQDTSAQATASTSSGTPAEKNGDGKM